MVNGFTASIFAVWPGTAKLLVMSSRATHVAFTLIELLVVTSIVAVLAAMLLPAVSLVKSAANQSVCASNQRQIGMAAAMYVSDNDGLLPWVQGTVYWWFHEPVLGQYMETRSVAGSTALADSNQIVNCPAAPRPTSGSIFARQGLNLRVLPSAFDVAMAKDYPLSGIARSTGLIAICVDGGDRFHPGYGTPPNCYGLAADQAGANWSAGDPLCYYNWKGRHHGGTNTLYLDGHVAFVADLRTEVQQGRVFVTR
jgi:prepilin-type N-terminal cleavage/methylation domain-containing protein/prepilin-type processing-associated H-X9-DG protein